MLPLNYILFLHIILFLFITPGTPRIVIISYSMNYGVQKCIWTALGDISANFAQGILVIFVLGSFFLDFTKSRLQTNQPAQNGRGISPADFPPMRGHW